MISGGADGAIKLWDLEQCGNPHKTHIFQPVVTAPRAPRDKPSIGHIHGVTHLSFYPFDPDAFLSSSYDKTLKLWSTERATISANFNLGAAIHTHATSPVAEHLLIACATQHSNIRLVDLRSGSAVQTLVSHGGPVLSAAWSPCHGHILATGHGDGKVRVWDVRHAGGVIGLLDQEDSLGVVHRFGHALATGREWTDSSHFRGAAQAHQEGVNGLTWTDDGNYIVSAGLDRRIRVWNATTGANTLASFGSLVQNRQTNTIDMFVSPTGLTSGSRELLFWPNEQEILVLDLHDGSLVTRLRVPGAASAAGTHGGGGLGVRNRITSMAWRGAGGGGRQCGLVMGGGNSFGAIYSAHLDGQIRAWIPRLPGTDEDADGSDDFKDEDEETKLRKRKAIDDAYRSLMGKQITFT
jgi:DNA excision repair protein ERCC-8